MASHWTEKEIEILKKMVMAGCMPDEIVKVLRSRTKESIYDKGYAIGLSFGKEPEIDLEAFKKIMSEPPKVVEL